MSMSESANTYPKKLKYCSLFCEENVYKMVEHFIECIHNSRQHSDTALEMSTSASSNLYVVFISSESKQTPIWYQKACRGNRPVLWDYHVVLVARDLPLHLLESILSDNQSWTNSSANRVACNSCSNIVAETCSNSNSNSNSNSSSSSSCTSSSSFIEDNMKTSTSDDETTSSTNNSTASYVFDLDSFLPFPTEIKKYFHLSVRPETDFLPQHVQQFRVIEAEVFLRNFSSDRCVLT